MNTIINLIPSRKKPTYLVISKKLVKNKYVLEKCWTTIGSGSHKQISFHSLKNYFIVAYKKALKKKKFPNFENFININKAYSNFIQLLTSVNDEIAPCKTKRVKGKWKEWFELNSYNFHQQHKLFL